MSMENYRTRSLKSILANFAIGSMNENEHVFNISDFHGTGKNSQNVFGKIVILKKMGI